MNRPGAQCHICGKDALPACVECGSGNIRTSTLEFVWNGYVAKSVEVCWCVKCDAVWIVDQFGERLPICGRCTELALAVPRHEIADAA